MTPSVVADHIKPVRTNPELAFAWDNLQGLCTDCHGVKRKEERIGKRIGCDVDGNPIEGW